jgi:hypothetical protein
MAHTVGGVVGFPPLPYSPLGDLQATFLRHFPPISVASAGCRPVPTGVSYQTIGSCKCRIVWV